MCVSIRANTRASHSHLCELGIAQGHVLSRRRTPLQQCWRSSTPWAMKSRGQRRSSPLRRSPRRGQCCDILRGVVALRRAATTGEQLAACRYENCWGQLHQDHRHDWRRQAHAGHQYHQPHCFVRITGIIRISGSPQSQHHCPNTGPDNILIPHNKPDDGAGNI